MNPFFLLSYPIFNSKAYQHDLKNTTRVWPPLTASFRSCPLPAHSSLSTATRVIFLGHVRPPHCSADIIQWLLISLREEPKPSPWPQALLEVCLRPRLPPRTLFLSSLRPLFCARAKYTLPHDTYMSSLCPECVTLQYPHGFSLPPLHETVLTPSPATSLALLHFSPQRVSPSHICINLALLVLLSVFAP